MKPLMWTIRKNDIGLYYIDAGETDGIVISACYARDMVGLTAEQVKYLMDIHSIQMGAPTIFDWPLRI